MEINLLVTKLTANKVAKAVTLQDGNPTFAHDYDEPQSFEIGESGEKWAGGSYHICNDGIVWIDSLGIPSQLIGTVESSVDELALGLKLAIEAADAHRKRNFKW